MVADCALALQHPEQNFPLPFITCCRGTSNVAPQYSHILGTIGGRFKYSGWGGLAGVIGSSFLSVLVFFGGMWIFRESLDFHLGIFSDAAFLIPGHMLTQDLKIRLKR